MLRLRGFALPAIMTFPKVCRLHVPFILVFFVSFLLLLKSLTARESHWNWISVGLNYCSRFLKVAVSAHRKGVSVSTSCVWPTSLCAYAVLLQMRVSAASALRDCSVEWPRPCWRCLRFTPRDWEQPSDRNGLSVFIHQHPVVPVVLTPQHVGHLACERGR